MLPCPWQERRSATAPSCLTTSGADCPMTSHPVPVARHPRLRPPRQHPHRPRRTCRRHRNTWLVLAPHTCRKTAGAWIVAYDLHLEALCFQEVAHHVHNLGLVVDDQRPCRCVYPCILLPVLRGPALNPALPAA